MPDRFLNPICGDPYKVAKECISQPVTAHPFEWTVIKTLGKGSNNKVMLAGAAISFALIVCLNLHAWFPGVLGWILIGFFVENAALLSYRLLKSVTDIEKMEVHAKKFAAADAEVAVSTQRFPMKDRCVELLSPYFSPFKDAQQEALLRMSCSRHIFCDRGYK